MKARLLALSLVSLACAQSTPRVGPLMTDKNAPVADAADPYLWLEEIDGAKAMDWVKARNATTVAELASSPSFEQLSGQILEVLDSDARIPEVVRRGEHLYNFWRDKQHPLGLWRRTTLAEYRKDKPEWELLIDLDALSAAEGAKYVWHGAICLEPEYRHCMILLSRGGADAQLAREYDLISKSFVAGGFSLPEAKSRLSWIDADTLFVGTDFGPGSMTASGYTRIAKRWKRGTPLSAATLVYEGKPEDLAITAFHDSSPGYERDFLQRTLDFYTSELYLLGAGGKLQLIDAPRDAEVAPNREWLLIQLRSPWTLGAQTYPSGALLAARFDEFVAGKRALTVLFTPTASRSLASYSWTRHHLILNLMEDVVSKLELLTPAEGDWKREPLGDTPPLSTVNAWGADSDHTDEYFMSATGFLAPATLYRGVFGETPAEPLKQAPSFFDSTGLAAQQRFATSKDGTRVPYFVIGPKEMKLDGSNPTLLYGYGGFEISLQPFYSGGMGRAWLARGGVYVVANIRGGGEYGPRWHQAALRDKRLRAYEDFAAVAEDLIAQKISSPAHLGAQGGSNGGLLMGNMITLYPELFGAVVCQVPLLDMKRYTHLSAGASWIAEYGDPDKAEEWAFIRAFSPYQNLGAQKRYPPALFTTSTRDDRVGPVHARKMAARMLELGSDVRFYENIEGGHGGAADNQEAAFMSALAYSFLWGRVK